LVNSTIIQPVNNSRSLNSTLVFAREWLNRSGELPPTIRVTLMDYWTKQSPRQMSGMEAIIQLINKYAHRWQDLHVSVPPPVSYRKSEATLKLDPFFLSIISSALRMHDSVQLTYASITSFALLTLSGRMTPTLTSGSSVGECLEMLRRAPGITDCKLTNISVDRVHTYLFLNHHIIHPNLKSLSVYWRWPIPPFFDHVLFPSLRELIFIYFLIVLRVEC
jgi:hypothetical protein